MVDILLKRLYGLNVLRIEKSTVGAGSDTYFAKCAEGKVVVKFPSVSEMNDPESEPKLCEFLLEKGINVCEFIKNKDGNFLSADDSGRVFHVQKFIEGRVYELNSAPDWLLSKSAEMLGKIHTALKAYKGLHVGIGADFFKYMTPENALRSYENSLRVARENGDSEIEAELFYYQISVCDYYGQYYSSAADNREIYLHQAVFSTRLMKWFERHISEITERISSI